MELDVVAVQGLVRDLAWSAQVVSDAGRRIAQAGQGFDASCAGAGYRSQGDRVAQALAGIASHVYGWANCTLDTAGLLGRAVAENVGVDRSTATGIGSKTEMLA